MSRNLRRTLISSSVFFVLFSALNTALQYGNADFSLSGVFTYAFFVTMLYTGFTWLFRRISGKGEADK